MNQAKTVYVKDLAIGGGSPVSVQSMANTDTRHVQSTVQQINQLADAGCDLVRISVYDEECAKAVRAIVDQSKVPVVADIHFNYQLALQSIENGIHKLRINPGNLANTNQVRRVADCAKAHHIPIRIGVNSGSIPKEIFMRDGGVTASGLIDSAASHVKLLEEAKFDNIVLSMKASNVRLTVDTYRLASKTFDYPLHLGVTEAGLPGQGTIKSAIGIGSLLLDGIGDTIRVSLTGDPINEPKAAIDILKAVGLRGGIEFVSCPTCGRTEVDVEGITKRLTAALSHIKSTLKVAVMGCVVNGPGEAKEADIALCGGKTGSALYYRGEFIKKVTGDPLPDLLQLINKILACQGKSEDIRV